MRILVATSSMGPGGAERVASTLCNAWFERGESVTLVPTFSGGGSSSYEISPGVEVAFLADLAGTKGRGPRGYWRRFWAFRRFIRTTRPDVIVSFLTNVNVAAILVAAGLGVRVIVCERTNPAAETQTSWILRLARRVTYAFANVVTVQTEEVAKYFRSYRPKIRRVRVIPNPLPQEIAVLVRTPDGSARPKRLVAMGRFTEEKQFSLLINAFAGLANKCPEWDLWIWGDGPLRQSLEADISRLGLISRIYLPGHTPKPWLELANAHAFVLTSAFEGFPNVLAEAMAIGLPCVAFDCPSGPREITLGGQVGLLVPPNDRHALVDALLQVMTDERVRQHLGSTAKESVMERFSVHEILRTWDKVFEEAGISRRSNEA